MTSLRAYPYSTNVRGVPHAIDDDKGRMVWAMMPPPTCECGASLGRYADWTDRRISVVGDRFSAPMMHCDTCGREAPIEEMKTCG